MNVSSDSFANWLILEIKDVLTRSVTPPPFILWCDPNNEWRDLLIKASGLDSFELWAPASGETVEHELLVRDRFYKCPREPRVVWLPCSGEDLTWFKVFELDAEEVWEKSLVQAMREYGIRISREQESELISILPSYVREWFDKPRSAWKELTPGMAKGALVDDYRMLQVIAGEPGEFDRLREEERFSIFARRAVEDFGLPDPVGKNEEEWRVAATARLLCTEAANASPQEPPGEKEQIIPAGLPRDRALKLLKSWQSNIDFISSFERLAVKADSTVGLKYWVRNLTAPPRSRSSRAVEETLFSQIAETLDHIEEVDILAKELEKNFQIYKDRENGFWGKKATDKVGWNHLVQLAGAASLLVENRGIEKTWKTVLDAINWYSSRGWQIDLAGENLFLESANFPQQLQRIRARLRRGYLRALDRIGRTFSDLLSKSSSDLLEIKTAGEQALGELERSKEPTALVFLDAFRLDLGNRLAELLNKGEPAQRATVNIAIAPIPSRTELGMPFALPTKHDQFKVGLSDDGKSFRVTVKDFDGELTIAEQRRKWLGEKMKVKEFLSIADVIDGEKLKKTGRKSKLIVVHGEVIDHEGHEGQLKLSGAEEHLERYNQAVRKLREAGYNRVIVVTDHGFFHWQPSDDEIEAEKPTGELLWPSRRAMVGRDLSHKSAVKLPVPQSDLEAMVPRSINAFKTYGALGFFHGGATLQEIIIPVIVVKWPAKAKKVNVVLKPVEHITSEAPRVEVEAGVAGQATLFGADVKVLARRVIVKVVELKSGKVVFKISDPVTITPEEKPEPAKLDRVNTDLTLPYGTPLIVIVIDADDEEELAREEITLKVDLDEW